MPASNWDTVQPTAGTPGASFEVGVDVQIGGAWVNVPDISAVNPQPTAKSRARSSYAAKGKTNPSTYARSWVLSFNVEIVRDNSGAYQTELQFLLDTASLLNQSNRVAVRFFDVRGAAYAYTGTWSVEHSRTNTGDDDAGFYTFTLTSYGDVTPIANPVLSPTTVPQIARVQSNGTPGTGSQVVIKGLAFTGVVATSGVKFGGVNATSFQFIDDQTIIAVLPSGSAGTTAVVVTNAAGASANFNITRGA